MREIGAYESQEERLIATALRSEASRRPLPPGMVARIESRLRALATETWRPATPRRLKCRGVFATRSQNTSGAEKDFAFYVNNAEVGDYKLMIAIK